MPAGTCLAWRWRVLLPIAFERGHCDGGIPRISTAIGPRLHGPRRPNSAIPRGGMNLNAALLETSAGNIVGYKRRGARGNTEGPSSWGPLLTGSRRRLPVDHIVAPKQLARGGAGAYRALSESHFAVDHGVANTVGLLDYAALATREVGVVYRAVILET